MGVVAGLYVYDVVVKSSRSLSHLLMSSCKLGIQGNRRWYSTCGGEWWHCNSNLACIHRVTVT